MTCLKCEQQIKDYQFRRQYGGCSNTYHCWHCHTDHISDGESCLCGFRCSCLQNKIPAMIIPGESFYRNVFSGKICWMPYAWQCIHADEEVARFCRVWSTKKVYNENTRFKKMQTRIIQQLRKEISEDGFSI